MITKHTIVIMINYTYNTVLIYHDRKHKQTKNTVVWMASNDLSNSGFLRIGKLLFVNLSSVQLNIIKRKTFHCNLWRNLYVGHDRYNYNSSLLWFMFRKL